MVVLVLIHCQFLYLVLLGLCFEWYLFTNWSACTWSAGSHVSSAAE